MADLCARYSPEELRIVLDLTRRSTEVLREQAARLLAEAGEGLDRSEER